MEGCSIKGYRVESVGWKDRMEDCRMEGCRMEMVRVVWKGVVLKAVGWKVKAGRL